MENTTTTTNTSSRVLEERLSLGDFRAKLQDIGERAIALSRVQQLCMVMGESFFEFRGGDS